MSIDSIPVRVAAIEAVAPMIREFRLEAIDGSLPAFSPGSHVQVAMPGEQREIRNAYSLCSDPRETGSYRIAVRLQEDSRGGSAFMHSQVSVGDRLQITPPANFFAPAWHARKHLLIAGGVGITPFMSYIPELERQGADFELHYLYRSSQTGAYRDELMHRLGQAFNGYDSDAGVRCDLSVLLSNREPGSHVYICGPESLIEGVRETARALGWPESLIHYEAFAAPEPGEPFKAKLVRSGRAVEVAADESLLEALEREGIEVPNLCRGGVCGQCVTSVVEGSVEHRDDFLSADEKASGTCIMPCVSRAAGNHLILDL
ncbi:PDR/VanB family oxidoreductase [Marinobacterium sediminicola]|uniref:Ferredoxin-NADP reductase n=1 Tax=Marinobacterium sediminicola TaxID=518898 RepID=A0ABY1S1P2_9GAMM|nr:PDR/VanB family oxidoreductase [Marinobacterium sediminicola]ULG69451.1 PDR/VanB family oxidoreductase [Marinobacterium sediminicola]SMR75601.1 Ferredoxin-NADP reductase [Marinobacterium sediminicola]